MESPKKTAFPPESFNYFYTMYTLITTVYQGKKEIFVGFQNGGQIPFFISRHFDFGENLKNHFSEGIFQ